MSSLTRKEFLNIPQLKSCLVVLILLGSIMRFYDLGAPWKRKGHYNYGGIHTTLFLECMKKTPLSISHGIPHADCQNGEAGGYYPNHPPTLIFAQWGWSEIFGDSEASLRSFVAVFSVLNILLVYLLAQALGFSPLAALAATAMQALFPGNMFFGTHNDFVCEFAMFFSILAGLLAIKGRIHWACLTTILAGLAAWPGYLGFAGLFVYQLYHRRKIWPVILWGALGFAVGLAMMMWLQQTFNILEFLHKKMVHQGYVEEKKLDYLYPLRWLYQAWQYHSTLLSPLFLFWGVLALRSQFLRENRGLLISFIAISGGGLVNAILGHQFIYIHEFNYLYLSPIYALLIGAWLNSQFATSANAGLAGKNSGFEKVNYFELNKAPAPRWLLWGMGLFIVATYSYGRYQSIQWLDISNNLIMALSVLFFASQFQMGALRPRPWIWLLVITALVNCSQLINWRNEPAMDYDFCQSAKKEYSKTHQPVLVTLEPDPSLDYYCRGIPLRRNSL